MESYEINKDTDRGSGGFGSTGDRQLIINSLYGIKIYHIDYFIKEICDVYY